MGAARSAGGRPTRTREHLAQHDGEERQDRPRRRCRRAAVASTKRHRSGRSGAGSGAGGHASATSAPRAARSPPRLRFQPPGSCTGYGRGPASATLAGPRQPTTAPERTRTAAPGQVRVHRHGCCAGRPRAGRGWPDQQNQRDREHDRAPPTNTWRRRAERARAICLGGSELRAGPRRSVRAARSARCASARRRPRTGRLTDAGPTECRESSATSCVERPRHRCSRQRMLRHDHADRAVVAGAHREHVDQTQALGAMASRTRRVDPASAHQGSTDGRPTHVRQPFRAVVDGDGDTGSSRDPPVRGRRPRRALSPHRVRLPWSERAAFKPPRYQDRRQSRQRPGPARAVMASNCSRTSASVPATAPAVLVPNRCHSSAAPMQSGDQRQQDAADQEPPPAHAARTKGRLRRRHLSRRIPQRVNSEAASMTHSPPTESRTQARRSRRRRQLAAGLRPVHRRSHAQAPAGGADDRRRVPGHAAPAGGRRGRPRRRVSATSPASVFTALRANPIAFVAFALAFLIVLLAGSALTFVVKGGTVSLLAVGGSGRRHHRAASAASRGIETRRSRAHRSVSRCLQAVLAPLRPARRMPPDRVPVTAVVYLAIIVGGYALADGHADPARLDGGCGAGVERPRRLDHAHQPVLSADSDDRRRRGRQRADRGAAAAAVHARRACVRSPRSSASCCCSSVLATVASILATAGLGLIAFVPFVGLAVVPLQFAAWFLRGVVFQYLALTALGGYLAQYRLYARGTDAAARPCAVAFPDNVPHDRLRDFLSTRGRPHAGIRHPPDGHRAGAVARHHFLRTRLSGARHLSVGGVSARSPASC